MIIHIDDCYVIGTKKTIEELVTDLKSTGLKIKVSYNATEYLSCDINMDRGNNLAWIVQTTLVASSDRNYGKFPAYE
jgi:hypothetical protein